MPKVTSGPICSDQRAEASTPSTPMIRGNEGHSRGTVRRRRRRAGAFGYPIVRSLRGFSIVIRSISACETPASSRRGRYVVCR